MFLSYSCLSAFALAFGYGHAFVPISNDARALTRQPHALNALPTNSIHWGTSSLVAVDNPDASPVAFEDAFQDQVNLLDGPIPIMLGVFGLVIVILAGLSFLSSKVDDAIYQTLKDFEATVRQYFPQKWQQIETQLENLSGEERDIKLLKIMEDMQEKEPEIMMRVRQKMDF